MILQLLFLLTGCFTALDTPSDQGALEEPDELEDQDIASASPCTLDANGRLPLAPESDYLPQGSILNGHREGCTSVMHATSGARESVLTLQLSDWQGAGGAVISVRDLLGEDQVEPTPMQAGDELQIPLVQTGEVLLVIESEDPDEAANDYALELRCTSGCEAAFTRYPIVLVHGLGGADSFGEIDYFYQVAEVLVPYGYAIHSPSVPPFSYSEDRGLELEAQLDALVEEGAARRFNLIGHSQGGLDGRYLVGGLGRSDLLASIITVGTPHQGTPIADFLYGTVEDGPVDSFWVDLGAEAFSLFFGLDGGDHSLVEAMDALSTESMADFNERVPDHEDVYYASWAGHSCDLLDFDCQEACNGEIVDPLLATTHFILSLYDISSDGMVPVESAVWGDYQGEICADHADEVGLFADTGNESFNHLAFYQSELERLAALGL